MAAVITELPSRMLQLQGGSAAINVKTSPIIIGLVILLLKLLYSKHQLQIVSMCEIISY